MHVLYKLTNSPIAEEAGNRGTISLHEGSRVQITTAVRRSEYPRVRGRLTDRRRSVTFFLVLGLGILPFVTNFVENILHETHNENTINKMFDGQNV